MGDHNATTEQSQVHGLEAPVIYFDAMVGFPGKGPVPSRYMFVGMAPSTKRPKERILEPFGSTAYQLVSMLRTRYGDELYLTNLIKEPVQSGKKLKVAQIRRWLPALQCELEAVAPRRVLCLGDQVSKAIVPNFKNLSEDHGTFFKGPGFWMIPTYHFAATFRNPLLKPILSRDLQRFFELPDPEPANYLIVGDPRTLDICTGDTVYLDLETTGVDDTDTITMVGLSTEARLSSGAPIWIMLNPSAEVLILLGKILERQKVTLIGHNLAFDLWMLLKETQWKFPRLNCSDTMLLAYLAGERTLALKHLTTFYTDLPGSRFGGGFTDPLYLAEDVRSTREIYGHFAQHGSRFMSDLLHSLVPTVSAMRFRGVYIDQGQLKVARQHNVEVLEDLEDKLRAYNDGAAINWGARAQLIPVLISNGVPLTDLTPAAEKRRKLEGDEFTPTPADLTVAEKILLKHVSHPLIGELLKWRAADKLERGFYAGYMQRLANDPTSCLHPRLLIYGTRTGRLSCREPNLQQVPREGPLKQSFVSRWEGGKYGIIDLSQAELRIAAYLSGDDTMCDALLSQDVHRYIASLIFKKPQEQISETERKSMKKITFGLLYGGSPAGLASRANISPEQVVEIVNIFFGQFPQLAKWLRTQKDLAMKAGRVTTLFGRVRDLSAELEFEGPGGVYRKAVNTPIQSLASDCMLWIMHQMDVNLRMEKLKTRLLFGVHDSLLQEIYPSEEERVATLVQRAFESLWETPLSTISMFSRLPLVGEFKTGCSWACVESTNEGYAPDRTWECSSLGVDWLPRLEVLRLDNLKAEPRLL